MATAFCLGLMRNICCTTLRIRRIGGRRLLPRVLSLIFFFRRGVRIINFHFNDLTHKNKNNERPDKMMMKNAGCYRCCCGSLLLFLQPFLELWFSLLHLLRIFPARPPSSIPSPGPERRRINVLAKHFYDDVLKGTLGSVFCIVFRDLGSGM